MPSQLFYTIAIALMAPLNFKMVSHLALRKRCFLLVNSVPVRSNALIATVLLAVIATSRQVPLMHTHIITNMCRSSIRWVGQYKTTDGR